MQTEKVVKTTWVSLMPAIFDILENGSKSAKELVKQQLIELAECVDTSNDIIREELSNDKK